MISGASINAKDDKTVNKVKSTKKISTAKIKIRFGAKLARPLPVEFEPDQKELTPTINKRQKTTFRFKNKSNKDIDVYIVHNIEPMAAAVAFKKYECFCFTEQKLKANSEVHMPLDFKVTDKLPKGIKDFEVSYTLYEKKDPNIKPMPKHHHEH